MSRYKREIDTQCCNAWMQGIRTINGQYPDDNRDFDINAGNGIRVEPATGGITIINDSAASSFVEGDNIEITPSGDDLIIGLVSDPVINGDLQVNGDIIQNGSAYETHAEQVYTTKDYIITRDGAISALSAGDYSGFQVKKYDGTNDGRLVIDNTGVARVGDVGDEQPLMTRSESASMTNGNLLQWNGTGQKAVDAGVNTSQIVRGSGNIGSDTQPIKVVNGVATPITNALQTALTSENITSQVTINTQYISGVSVAKYGKMVTVSFTGSSTPLSTNATAIITGLPPAIQDTAAELAQWTDGQHIAMVMADTYGNIVMWGNGGYTAGAIYSSLTYISQ